MSNSSLVLHPMPLQQNILQHWVSLLTQEAYEPTWILSTISPTLGFERSMDILWLGLVLPQLGPSSSRPIWMENVALLARHYATGIDLMDPTIYNQMDVADLQALFPSTIQPEVARDVLLTYKRYIDFCKQVGHPAHVLLQSPAISSWLQHWETWNEGPSIQVYTLLPMIYQIANLYHITVEPIEDGTSLVAAHVLWSSGVLDMCVDLEDEETMDYSQSLLQGAHWAIHELSKATGNSTHTIIQQLHAFFEVKIQNSNGLRPWLWGHTPSFYTTEEE